jgi:hypothetical protein
MTLDASGLERVPFDGRPLTLPTIRRRPRTTPGHGPTCRPSNPEIGCECGEDERRAEAREWAELRAAGLDLCSLCGMVYDPRTSEHFTPEQMSEVWR